MLKVSSLFKTYNKGKSNEIKVINDTSLELPSTGLVSFLGQSGSGKTTLLNAIGLLDKTDSGKIEFDDVTIDKYDMSKIDSFRSHYIGYIFQNYNLLPDISVEENLKVALDLINVSGEEATKRIAYVLNAVGLYKYRKKPASALSGGQQQRVSIARCLVKNSKLIIADEPTGNLDSKNTIEIMNILKKVSQNTLVLLVTHDRNIAEVYSSQVVEISDGVVTNVFKPRDGQVLSKNKENTVYLKDLDSTQVNDNNVSMDIYSDSKIIDCNLKVICVNGTYYIDSNLPIKLLKDSNVQIKNEHYTDVSTKTNEEFEYDTSWYTNKEGKRPKYIKRSFINSVKEFFYTRKRTKFFHIAFLLIGVLLGLANYLLISNSYIDTKNFDTEKDAIVLNANYTLSDDLKQVLVDGMDDGIIEDVYRDDTKSYYTSFQVNSFISSSVNISYSIYSDMYIKDYSLICGRMPNNSTEIVIGKDLADKIIDEVGYDFTYELILGSSIYTYKIVGISSKNTNQVYTANSEYETSHPLKDTNLQGRITSVGYKRAEEYNVVYGSDLSNGDTDGILVCVDELSDNIDEYKELVDNGGLINGRILKGLIVSKNPKKPCSFYVAAMMSDDCRLSNGTLYAFAKTKSDYYIIEGRDAVGENEILVNGNVGREIGEVVDGYTIVGKYQFTDEYPNISSSLGYKSIALLSTRAYIDYMLEGEKMYYHQIHLYGDDIDSIKTLLSSNDVEIISNYTRQYNNALEDMKMYTYLSYAIIAVLFVLSIIYVYFTMRAKMISDIYSIGVYRALGSSRSRINLKYIIDVIVLTIFTTFIGYLLFTLIFGFIATKLNSLGGSLANVLTYPQTYLFIPLIFVINLVFGLLPIITLLRKTPSEIISKYDI